MLLEVPKSALIDEPCRVVVGGLVPGAEVRVAVYCDYGQSSAGSRVFEASAVFRAGEGGHVDVATMSPISGDWRGDHSGHGPWWAAGRTGRPSRIAHGGDIPTSVRVSVRGGASEVTDRWTRRRWSRGVTCRQVDGDGFRGRVWAGPPGTARAALVWLGGSGGGFPAGAAGSVLASRGIDTIEVAYFAVDGLPASLRRIPVGVVARAATALEAVTGRSLCPVVLGVSRGSELALLAGSYDPGRFAGVIGVVPSGTVHGGLGASGPIPDAAWTLGGDAVSPRSVIPIDRIPGPVLLLAASDDQVWPSARFSEEAMSVRGLHRHPLDRCLRFEGAGHTFFAPPGLPRVDRPEPRPHPITGRLINVGGSRQANAKAAQLAWESVLALLAAI